MNNESDKQKSAGNAGGAALPRISVATPSFNQASYMDQCVRSVREQEYPNVEHIVFDGGSTDGTLEVLRRYDGVVRWTSEPDKGQSDAINKGFLASTGDIVGWVNSDDWYLRGAFRLVADYFRAHPEADFVYGNCLFTDNEGQVIRRVRSTPYRWEWLLFGGCMIPQPGTFMRRRVLEDCGLLDIRLRTLMDYEWWLRIAKKHQPHFIDRYLAGFRVHAESISGAGRLDARWREERWDSMQRHDARFPTLRQVWWGKLRALVGRTLWRAGRLLAGGWDRGLNAVPRVVVLTGGVEAAEAALFNALHDHHDMETQVWSLAPSPASPKPAWWGGKRFSFRSVADERMWMRGRGFEKRRFVRGRRCVWRHLWLERPDVVVLDGGSLAAAQAVLYAALMRAAVVWWDGAAASVPRPGFWRGLVERWMRRRARARAGFTAGAEEFCRAIRQALASCGRQAR